MMPEDSKKNLNKSKPDPKEQRKPRRQNQQTCEKKGHIKVEESKAKVPATSSKPVIKEEPGPEFYKNLKRETEEILKISEEANSKYKKKEIQSNWAKYEMPIESYEEVEEHDLGADYEKLVQTPMSIGGHFQFKHEKSWDVNTGPSPYDKYFEIDMANLATALNTIPFYERNAIDLSMFSESDKLSMENRSVKYKRKYFNDKSYTSAELEAQEKIENSLLEILKNSEESNDESNPSTKDIHLEELSVSNDQKTAEIIPVVESAAKQDIDNTYSNASESKIFIEQTKETVHMEHKIEKVKDENPTDTTAEVKNIVSAEVTSGLNTNQMSNENDTLTTNSSIGADADQTKEADVKPVIQSPEDLEKWLDDFLDG